MDKKGGGIKIFLRNIFLSQCRKTSQGNPLLFHSFHVSKNLRNKKNWGGASTVSAEDFLSHSAKYFVGQPFCALCSVSEICQSEKV